MIAAARTLSLAGITSNAELGARFSVSPGTISNWRKQFPAFDEAITGGAADHVEALTSVVVRSAMDGNTADAKWLLERRAPTFKPSSQVDIQGKVEGLADMLARRTSDADLRKAGVLIDDED